LKHALAQRVSTFDRLIRLTKCAHCDRTVDMPFVCSYCEKPFCADHRLPESHSCTELMFAKRPARAVSISPPERWRWTPRTTFPVMISSEVKELLIAWLVLSFCASVGTILYPGKFLKVFSISLATLGLGFIGHELMHRNVARRYGCWAEFKLWRMGLAMALLFAFASGGRMIFAAPGAVYISSFSPFGIGISKKVYGVISISGPLANLIVASLFFILISAGGIWSEIGHLGYSVNMWLAAFNLLPFGVMDGQKVFQWSSGIWAVVTLPAWILTFLPAIL